MKIVEQPDKILKKKTRQIEKIDEDLIELIENMWPALEQAKGVGLAAPQIGKSISLAIVGFEPTEEMLKKNPGLKSIPKTVLINPKIIWSSLDKSVEKEGCLSCGKTEIDVPRYKKIHVEHLDEKGRRKKLKARGYFSRVLQHEIDHLNGILITDYSPGNKK